MKTITIIRDLECLEGRLFYLRNGQRRIYTDCDVDICIEEEKFDVPILNSRTTQYKTNRLIITFCEYDPAKVDSTVEFLRSVDGFDIEANIRRSGDKYEKIRFCNVFPDEVDNLGEWKFIIDDPRMVKRIMEL